MFENVRDNIGIAIDGGGVRGVIVARALLELEKEFGSPLINNPRLKVLAGTSTGSLITTALAAGMTANEILTMYQTLGDRIFSKTGNIKPFGYHIPLISQLRMPAKLLRFLRDMPGGEFLLYMLLPARYSFDPLRQTMREYLQKHPSPNTDPTMKELGNFLSGKPNNPTLIITAVEIQARRTRFIKTNSERFYHMKLVDAMLASSCIPTYWEPIPIPDEKTGKPTDRLLVDGGVGNFGNPALPVAWELCDIRNNDAEKRYTPSDVTIFSFGTGYISTETYMKKYPNPVNWWALDWAARSLDLFLNDANREQSRNIVTQYRGVDLRRFQVQLEHPINADRFDLINTDLKVAGEEMARLVRENRHAFRLEEAYRHDPEEIWNEDIERLLKKV